MDDTATVGRGLHRQRPIDVLANDTDPDAGDTLTVTAVIQPDRRHRRPSPPAPVTYTPTANFTGTDTFTYTVTDAAATTDTATVTDHRHHAGQRRPDRRR